MCLCMCFCTFSCQLYPSSLWSRGGCTLLIWTHNASLPSFACMLAHLCTSVCGCLCVGGRNRDNPSWYDSFVSQRPWMWLRASLCRANRLSPPRVRARVCRRQSPAVCARKNRCPRKNRRMSNFLQSAGHSWLKSLCKSSSVSQLRFSSLKLQKHVSPGCNRPFWLESLCLLFWIFLSPNYFLAMK